MNDHDLNKLDVLRTQISKLVEEYSKVKYQPCEFKPAETAIPPSGKLLDSRELVNMVEASLDGWLTTGRFNKQFEEKLASFLSTKYVFTVNSGSSANLLALTALTSNRLGDKALKKGDEVITVAACFPTTVNPIIQNQLIPVFVDVDPKTYNIDVNLLEAAVTEKTRAIMLAHTLGNPFNIEKVMEIANKYDLWVVEDCCDALGTTFTVKDKIITGAKHRLQSGDTQLVGTFGHVSTLSFYPAHHITMGEGGAVFTQSKKLSVIIESLRDWGRDCYCEPGQDNSCNKRFCWKLGRLPLGYDHKYIYSHVGYNLKITEMQAACGLAQLEKLPNFIEQRKKNFNYLYENLQHLSDYLLLPEETEQSDPSWFGFPITLKENSLITRVELLKKLDEHKVGTRLLFAGNIICQPYMQDQVYRVSGTLPVTDTIMHQTFWIGVQPALVQSMLDYIIEVFEEIFS